MADVKTVFFAIVELITCAACVSERFSLIRRRKKSVQLCPQETTHPIFQFHQIVQFHVKEIVHPLRFLSWRDSEFLIPRPTA